MYGQLAALLLLPLATQVSGLPSGLINSQRADDTKRPLGCSDASFGNFAWTISGFVYNASYTFTTPAHQNSWGYLHFDVANPAFASDKGSDGEPLTEAICDAASSRINDFFYGDTPYACPSPTEDRRRTQFTFDRTTGMLRLNESWVCADRDPQFPTIFSAYGSVELDLDCHNTSYVNSNWTIGEIYSNTVITCKPVDLTLKADEISAIA